MAAEAAMDKGRDREPWQKETTSVHLSAVASFRFPGTWTHEKALLNMPNRTVNKPVAFKRTLLQLMELRIR
jgi:hypothetical protein